MSDHCLSVESRYYEMRYVKISSNPRVKKFKLLEQKKY